jgi:hypothetical protein
MWMWKSEMSIGLAAIGLATVAMAGCATDDNGTGSTSDDEISCGYYTERSGYALTNFQTGDFESTTTWAEGLPISRHLRKPAPDSAFDWLPLSESTVLNHGASGVGGLGRVSNDPRCQDALDLFDDGEPLTNDPDGFTYVEQRAELRFAAVGFAFPTTRAQADAAPDTQNVAVDAIADLTRDKTRTVSGDEVRQTIAKQTVTFAMTCDTPAQVTKRWAPRIARDDPAFCRANATGGMECVQFNLVFASEHCTLAADAVAVKLPSGTTTASLGGSLTLQSPATYQLRIDDIRLAR